jgi:hypothetical protein
MLPAGRMLPRPNTLEIEVLPPIYPNDVAFTDSRKLAETARLDILAVLDEPDLAESDPDPQAALSN